MNDEVKESVSVTLMSFGFKYGRPEDVNYVWDVRFLPNPYWEESLKHLTGKDDEVAEYVVESDRGEEFISLLVPVLEFLIGTSRETGKPELRVGIGCTGGHHRSVAVVEKLAHLFRKSVHLEVEHRHIDRE